MSEELERQSNQRRSSQLLDTEQSRRVAEHAEADEYAEIERKQNVRKSMVAADLEQARRVAEVEAADMAAQDERKTNQSAATEAAESERTRRLSLAAAADAEAELARLAAQAESLKLQDEEQTRRVEEAAANQPPPAVLEARKSIKMLLSDLPLAAAEEASAEGGAGGTYAAAAHASKNIASLMATDNEDESLARYKAALLGAAAQGDLGDTSDPRRVIVTEFRIVFEDPAANDVVYNLDTEAGIANLRSTPFTIKEGANYKFRISFRVQHEIVTGLKFANKVKKGIFSQSGDVMLGSYAPQSEPHTFEFPRRGWNEAPSGMMYRGRYTSHDQYLDSDGAKHLEYDYTFEIKKKWQ